MRLSNCARAIWLRVCRWDRAGTRCYGNFCRQLQAWFAINQTQHTSSIFLTGTSLSTGVLHTGHSPLGALSIQRSMHAPQKVCPQLSATPRAEGAREQQQLSWSVLTLPCNRKKHEHVQQVDWLNPRARPQRQIRLHLWRKSVMCK